MEFEDSRNALFTEPNAYIQHYESKEKTHPKKIIFQEPYENFPNFYIDNDFKKNNNDNIDKKNNNNAEKNYSNKKSNFPFNFKNIFPFLGALTNGGGLGNLISAFSNNTSSGDNKLGNNLNISNLINMFSSNNGENNLLNLFNLSNISGLFNKKNDKKKEMKSTDFCIKDYERIN